MSSTTRKGAPVFCKFSSQPRRRVKKVRYPRRSLDISRGHLSEQEVACLGIRMPSFCRSLHIQARKQPRSSWMGGGQGAEAGGSGR